MASRTQIRLAQMTGSFAAAGDSKSIITSEPQSTIANINVNDLSGSLSVIASAIGRIHGASSGEAFNNAEGTFYTDIIGSGSVLIKNSAGTQHFRAFDSTPTVTIGNSTLDEDAKMNFAANSAAPSSNYRIGHDDSTSKFVIGAGNNSDMLNQAALVVDSSLNVEVINDLTVTGNDINLGNGATIINTDANTLTITEATVVAAGNLQVNGNITGDSDEAKSIFAESTSNAITLGGGGTVITAGDLQVNGTAIDVDSASALAIGATVGANDLTLGASNSTVVVAGNLTVNGTTTTVNSTTVSIDDQFILLADGAQVNNTPSGIVFASGSNVPARPDVAFARVANDTWALGTVASNSGSNTNSVPVDFDVALRAFKVELGAAAEYITADGTDVTIAGGSGDITLDAADDIILDAGGDIIAFKKAATLAASFDMSTTGDFIVKDADGTEIFRIDGSENGLAIPNNGAVAGGGGNGGMLTFNGATNTNAAIYGNDGNLYLRSGNNAVRMPILAGSANQVMITDGANGNLSFTDADALITDVNGRATYKVITSIAAGAPGLILTSSQFDDSSKLSHMFAPSSPCYTGSLADPLFAVGDDKKPGAVEMYVNGQLLASGAAVTSNGVHADCDYNFVSVSQSQISASFAFDLEVDDMVTLVLR